MPLGVGMADIAIGKALWIDLVRQIAVRTRDQDDAEDFLRWLVSADTGHRPHSRALKSAAIPRQLEAFFRFRMKALASVASEAKVIWESVGALPAITR